VAIVAKKSKASRAKNGDLPEGASEDNRFRRAFIPTLSWFHARLMDTFNVPDKILLKGMQLSWNASYGKKLPYEIELNDSVFQVVSHEFPPCVFLMFSAGNSEDD
jgi:hypothetical protein